MTSIAWPVLFALFVWWFSTGAVIWLDGLPRRTFRWSMLGASVILSVALYGLVWSSDQAAVGGAYVAFTCGLLIWGWHEMSFLMGFVTGSRTEACAEGCSGWRHFGHAVETILYHELAILMTAVAVLALTWGEVNQIGTWTFMILWWLRLSAKLNVFLGVPNLTEEFLPEHLQYLKRFFTRRPMNALFPLSVTASTVALALLVHSALDAPAGSFEATGLMLLATLLALAVLEHWFLVLPLPDAILWQWALRSRETRRRSGVTLRLATPAPIGPSVCADFGPRAAPSRHRRTP
jgi:putative photosynthetic complex assembly protein 2